MLGGEDRTIDNRENSDTSRVEEQACQRYARHVLVLGVFVPETLVTGLALAHLTTWAWRYRELMRNAVFIGAWILITAGCVTAIVVTHDACSPS